jgi:regulator of sigma E protease
MSIVIAILALSFLIIVHEIGHFTAAKLLNVKVLEFSIFMGPKLFSVKKGETEYSMRLVPIGGFVKMEGEEEESEDERAFNKKPKWVRAIILSAGSAMNLLTAFILMLIISLNFAFEAPVISETAPGSPAETAGLVAGDTILKYGDKTVNTFDDLYIYMVDTKGEETSVTYERSGQVTETLFKPERYARNYYLLGFKSINAYGSDWNIVDSLTEGGPAAMAGVAPGDRLISINGVTLSSREELRNALEAGSGETAVVGVDRGGQHLTLNIKPESSNSEEFFSPGANFTSVRSTGFFEACKYAYHNSISGCRMVIYSLKWLVTGYMGIGQMSGPVGIVATIGDVVEQTSTNFSLMTYRLLTIVALIGINLGLFNLIPFPALDGSKLLLILIEAIRKKKIPPEREMAISLFGFAALILLMVVTLFNDIGRLITK